MLLDTPSLYFRAFYGVPDSVVSPKGEPINAVRGLLDMIARLVGMHPPQRLVAAMDHDWRPQFRVDLLPSYKLHRVATVGHGEVVEEIPDLLSPQVPVIEEVLEAVGIAVVGAQHCEADDVIGTLCTRHLGAVDVVTGDRDLFQLVDDSRPVRVLYTQKGLANLLVVDETTVTEKYGIPGRSYADFALLRGDPSDGLPGVAGIGDKTAAALLQRHGSVQAMRDAIARGEVDGFPAGARAKLVAAADYLDVAPQVVAVVCDAPLPDIDDLVPRTPKDPQRLVELADRWGLDSSLNRLLTALSRTEESA
jgi:5'-3' exonuclease